MCLREKCRIMGKNVELYYRVSDYYTNNNGKGSVIIGEYKVSVLSG